MHDVSVLKLNMFIVHERSGFIPSAFRHDIYACKLANNNAEILRMMKDVNNAETHVDHQTEATPNVDGNGNDNDNGNRSGGDGTIPERDITFTKQKRDRYGLPRLSTPVIESLKELNTHSELPRQFEYNPNM